MPNRIAPLAKPCPAIVDSASGGAMSLIVDGGGILGESELIVGGIGEVADE